MFLMVAAGSHPKTGFPPHEGFRYTRNSKQRSNPMADAINFPGTVEWSGENPGISLKESPDGPFVTLASFFRVVLSPFGRGHALVLLQSTQEAGAR